MFSSCLAAASDNAMLARHEGQVDLGFVELLVVVDRPCGGIGALMSRQCVGRAASSLPVRCSGLGQLALPASRAAPPSRVSPTSGARSPRPPPGPVPPTCFSSCLDVDLGA